jgi:hypothetical protein
MDITRATSRWSSTGGLLSSLCGYASTPSYGFPLKPLRAKAALGVDDAEPSVSFEDVPFEDVSFEDVSFEDASGIS